MKEIIRGIILLLFPVSAVVYASQDPIEVWTQYVKSKSLKDSLDLIEDKYRGAFISTLPPSSPFTKKLIAEKSQVYRDHHAQIFISFEQNKSWLAMKKNGNKWKLTLDEKDILEELTNSWFYTKVGRFHVKSPKKLSNKDIKHYESLGLWANFLDEKFNNKIENIHIYNALDSNSANLILGSFEKGAGSARNKVIKSYLDSSHKHELIHVYSLELLGSAGPFLDEGLASFIANDIFFSDESTRKSSVKLINIDLSNWLDAGFFMSENADNNIGYVIAQHTMKYWFAKFGFNRVFDLMKAVSVNPLKTKQLISEIIEPIELSEPKVKQLVQDSLGF